ncbi:MAG: hypothetical protein ACRCWD_07350 [Culicoidibacterales bacterium]
MNRKLRIACDSCQSQREFNVGTILPGGNIQAFSTLLYQKYPAMFSELEQLLLQADDYFANHNLYFCQSCQHVEVQMHVCLFTKGKLLYESQFRCSFCQQNIHKTQYKKVEWEAVICPHCETKAVSGIFLSE